MTVRHLVRPELAGRVGAGPYYLCLDAGCAVVYYAPAAGVFARQQVRVPVWFKAGADPRYICYCGRVTEQEIAAAVREGGARDLAAVARLTGAMRSEGCEYHNPTGRCCGNLVRRVIDRTLAEMGEREKQGEP